MIGHSFLIYPHPNIINVVPEYCRMLMKTRPSSRCLREALQREQSFSSCSNKYLQAARSSRIRVDSSISLFNPPIRGCEASLPANTHRTKPGTLNGKIPVVDSTDCTVGTMLPNRTKIGRTNGGRSMAQGPPRTFSSSIIIFLNRISYIKQTHMYFC